MKALIIIACCLALAFVLSAMEKTSSLYKQRQNQVG